MSMKGQIIKIHKSCINDRTKDVEVGMIFKVDDEGFCKNFRWKFKSFRNSVSLQKKEFRLKTF